MKRGLFNGFITSSLLNHYFVVNETKPKCNKNSLYKYDFYKKMLTITNSYVIIIFQTRRLRKLRNQSFLESLVKSSISLHFRIASLRFSMSCVQLSSPNCIPSYQVIMKEYFHFQ